MRGALALTLRSGVEANSADLVVRAWLDEHERFEARVVSSVESMQGEYGIELTAVHADLDPSAEAAPVVAHANYGRVSTAATQELRSGR